MNKLLQIQNLGKTYRNAKRSALSNMTLDVDAGEIVAIVGESGSGKTTMIRIIAGFETPDTGSVDFDGRRLVDPHIFTAPEDRGIGMVFQDLALFPHLTVKKNLLFGVKNSRQRTDAYVQELLELVGLPGLQNRYPHEISGGQVQRIALARALASQPRLLLLDEPFNNLDIRIKNSLLREMREIIKQTGTTTLFITHEKSEAFMMADRIAVLRDGKLQQCDRPQQIYASPANTYVAEFFGQANHIPAEIHRDGIHTPFGLIDPQQLAAALPANVQNGFLVHRPWDVIINDGDQAGIPVTISHSYFFGDHQEVYFRIPGAADIEFKMFVHRERLLPPGTPLNISLKANHLAFCTH